MKLISFLSTLFLTVSFASARTEATKQPRVFQLVAVLDLGDFKEGGMVGPVAVNSRSQLAVWGGGPFFTGLLYDDGRVKVSGTQSWLGLDETTDGVYTDVLKVGNKSSIFTIVNEQFFGVTELDSKGYSNTSTFVAIRDPEVKYQYLIYNRRCAPKDVDGKPVLLRVFWSNNDNLAVKGESFSNLSKFSYGRRIWPLYYSNSGHKNMAVSLKSFTIIVNVMTIVACVILF